MIVPAFNAENTIGLALGTVLSQTFEDYELIVVDDGSVDGTADETAAFIDPRFRYVHSVNRGVSAARNEGIACATGTYVAFLDADDSWREEKLERQVELLGASPAGFCFTSAEWVDEHLNPVGFDAARVVDDYSKELVLTGNVIPGGGSSPLVQRDLINSLGGFDTALSQCADWDMWLRLSLVTDFVALSEPLTRYRKAPGTMSSDPALLERDTFALLDKFFATEASAQYAHLRRRAYGHHWMVCAGTYLHAGAARESIRCVRRGLRADPRTASRPLLLPIRAASRWTKAITSREPGC